MAHKVKAKGLKPCPFCGREAQMYYSNDYESVFIHCKKWGNGCAGQSSTHIKEEDAIGQWNTRYDHEFNAIGEPLDDEAIRCLENFKKEMEEVVIPQIVQAVKQRQKR